MEVNTGFNKVAQRYKCYLLVVRTLEVIERQPL